MAVPRAGVVLLDRDGVINANRDDHVTSWAQFRFLPGALEGIALLADRGLKVVVVTNQAIVNRGLVSRAAVDEIHERMLEAIARHGGRVTGVEVCPHRPDEGCGCRKPAPGLVTRAAQRHGFELAASIMVGDHDQDLETARRAGCRSILVLSGRTIAYPSQRLPAGCLAVLPGLLEAARYIAQERWVPLRAESLGATP